MSRLFAVLTHLHGMHYLLAVVMLIFKTLHTAVYEGGRAQDVCIYLIGSTVQNIPALSVLLVLWCETLVIWVHLQHHCNNQTRIKCKHIKCKKKLPQQLQNYWAAYKDTMKNNMIYIYVDLVCKSIKQCYHTSDSHEKSDWSRNKTKQNNREQSINSQ